MPRPSRYEVCYTRECSSYSPHSVRAVIRASSPLRPTFAMTIRSRRQDEMLGYLIDMDGVIYKGHELIPGADAFIQELRSRGVPFLFLTNNSQRTRRDVATRLQRMGLDVEEEHVYTCAMATARF